MKKLRFGIVGQYQSGKSLFINCLLGRSIASVGVGTATTHTIINYFYSENDEYIKIIKDNESDITRPIDLLKDFDTDESTKVINVYIHNEILKHYVITDMPGFGSNDRDNEAALSVLLNIDYAIVITSNNKSFGIESSAYNDFCILQRYNIPYYFFINCTEFVRAGQWNPHEDNNKTLAMNDLGVISFYKPISYPFNENEIPIVNLMWYWYSIQDNNDEILQRKEIKNAIAEYELDSSSISREEIKKASNFELIEKIFSMENKAYLELKREFKEEMLRLKDEICPVGTIQTFAYNLIPKGWMVCDGRKLDSKVHNELFSAIGTTFGGDGDNYFCIPDLRGRFIRGWDNVGNIDKERQFGTYQEDSLQGHYHELHMESNKTKKDGKHDHYIGYEELYFGTNNFMANEPCKSVKGCDEPHVLSYGDGSRAIHDHELPQIEVRDICNGKHGVSRVASETRPKNCALLYCIKVNPLIEGGDYYHENTGSVENNLNEKDKDTVISVDAELEYELLISKLYKYL